MRLTWDRIFSIALTTLLVTALGGLVQAEVPTLGGNPLSFEDRVRHQRAIEEVYWRHRIWPMENPGPKPTLDELLPDAVLRARVASYLQKSAALEVFWSRPLTGEQLQAEVNRMARNTKKPDLLRELFAALDNDPLLVAECLARPVLAERLARNWYARDDRFHGALREQAETALAAHPNAATRMRDLGGEYVEIEWRLARDDSEVTDLDTGRTEDPTVELTAEEWRERIGRLAASFGIEREPGMAGATDALLEEIPTGSTSRLAEERDRFVVTTVLSKEPDRLRTATVSWTKRPFDTWLAEEIRTTVESSDGTDRGSIPPPSGGYELPSTRDSGCSADTWTALSDVPTPRWGHTAVWTGSEMIVWGGWARDGNRRAGGRYDAATDSWTPTSTGANVPTERGYHTAVWTGTEMIVWGGLYGGVTHNTGGRYDPATNSWTATLVGANVPARRILHTAVWTGTEMIVWGGRQYYWGEVYETGGRYDPATDSWTATSTGANVPTARYYHKAVWTGTEMIVWGGDNGSERLDTGGRYDPATDSWTATSTGANVPTARYYHTAVWTGTEMIIWGGGNGSERLDTGGRYDPVTDSWTATSIGENVPTAREFHTAVWTGTEMIVWGGGEYDQREGYDTGGRYDPATDGWTATSSGANVPTARYYHTAVWTGAEMIVWGGDNGSERLDTGGRYDPATDSWTATSTGANVPTARYYHTAVWTGAEMIVWGGLAHLSEPLDTGGRYDPATDSWTATSTGANVPTERGYHTAVWTGSEMIVWGGRGYNWVHLDTGGRYDPATDTWVPTSTGADVPTVRAHHTAVWTGSEMIVWGGSGATNTGGRYNPADDAWMATSTGAGVPDGRSQHTAVWTGEEMIVWGGDNGSERLDTGGRYDPAADSWTATSTGTGVPDRKYRHTAVWTGTEMIVWGGCCYTNTGGRYNPADDSWMATSTGTGVPVGRSEHTAVWTGTEMIVWGGFSLNSPESRYLNSGGRYDPTIDSWVATSTETGAPDGRTQHTAVWTGTKMIVWGGYMESGQWRLNTGGLYCVCEGGEVQIWYPDADGDGLGADSTGIPACEQPSGYIAVGGDCDDRYASCTTDCTDADLDGLPACAPDCNDSNPNCTTDCTDNDNDEYCVTHDCDETNADTHPGAPEVNDGQDNNCPGDLGHGIVDEISGSSGFHDAMNLDRFSWTAQGGATEYEVARSTDPRFVSDCTTYVTTDSYWDDGTPVPEGTCFYYLVRSHEPNMGSWGADSGGIERTVTCHR